MLVTPPGARAQAPAPSATRLGYWQFNTADWRGDHGQLPLDADGAVAGEGIDGRAAEFTGSLARAGLRYRLIEASGRVNFNATNGSIRFLYRPNWMSRDPMALPGSAMGSGPGHWVSLVEIGPPDGPASLALTINPDGTQLALCITDAAGVTRTNLVAPLRWTRPGGTLPLWHEVTINYTSANTTLFVDGVLQADAATKAAAGPGVPPLGTADGRLTLAMGASLTGEHAAEGRLDELETFNYLTTPLEQYSALQQTALSATVRLTPPAVTLRWYAVNEGSATIRRRLAGATNWAMVSGAASGMSFTDQDGALQAGQTYEYLVTHNWSYARTILVPLAASPVERRGRVILLVDQTLAARLQAPLDRLRADLVGDGWTVIRHDVPRQGNDVWNQSPVNPAWIADVARVKSLIEADYAAAPAETKAVFILGHVTVPYSGAWAEDGHPDHGGAWPADSYYGDMDGHWSDSAANNAATTSNPVLRNIPGDGKFDPHDFKSGITPANGSAPNGVELGVGRVDFANLPAFQPQTEADLLQQYLEKDHRYRLKQIVFERPAIVAGYFSSPFSNESLVIYDNAAWNLSRLVGRPAEGVTPGDCFLATTTSYLWGMQGGYGGPATINCDPGANQVQGISPHETRHLAGLAAEPRIGFYLLKGSYFGDWNQTPDNLLRACLATRNHGLAAVWTRDSLWHFESLAAGDTLGSGFVRTARGAASTRTTALLGDPTLRARLTAPPGQPTATRTAGATRLGWQASPEATAGYLVYRSARGLDGPFERLNPAPVTGTSLTDAAAPAGRQLYAVRAAELVSTGSGSYTNLSQAVFVTVE